MQQQMTCPKCLGPMRQYERGAVIVDQCQECRGIFLDRGELERLTDAENSYHGRTATYEAPRSSYQQQYPHKKKKHSFFEELFD
jgi:Zn-finger nucleic acid-binding protein